MNFGVCDFLFCGYGLALAALALVLFGAYDSYPLLLILMLFIFYKQFPFSPIASLCRFFDIKALCFQKGNQLLLSQIVTRRDRNIAKNRCPIQERSLIRAAGGSENFIKFASLQLFYTKPTPITKEFGSAT